MGDKEILAELKRSYEYLQDIIDNADNTQLKSIVELEKAQYILAEKYDEVYNKVKNENANNLYYKKDENIIVSPYISGDYIITYNKNEYGDYDYLTSGDLDWQKWWEDYKFIERYEEE